MLLNSNAETHFSFTNALGLVSAEQARGPAAVGRGSIPRRAGSSPCIITSWNIPSRAAAFSERIGTALINGTWFVRQLQRPGARVVRCTDTATSTGSASCGHAHRLRAVPVMEATDEYDTAFYIHTLAIGSDGQLRLLKPERIVVKGEREAAAKPRAAKAG